MGLRSFIYTIGNKASKYFYTRFMQPIANTSKDALALDHSQIFPVSGYETETEYRVFYTGQSAVSITTGGRTYTNTDQTFLMTLQKSNNVRDGWVKHVGVDGKPKPVLQPSTTSSDWDGLQVWLRSVILEGSTLKGWYIGERNSDHIHKVGYATSTDGGLTWTKYGSNPVYSDASGLNGRIISAKVIKDGSHYKMFYSQEDPNVTGIQVAQSTDGITGWTKTHSNLLADQNLGYLGRIEKIGSWYYIWTGKEFSTGSGIGPATKIALYRTIDLVNFQFLGNQIAVKPAHELGVGADVIVFRKPNSGYFLIHTIARNALEVSANGGEQFCGMGVAELNRSDSPVANTSCKFAYPSYVKRHYPLNDDHYTSLKFKEVIKGEEGTINSTPTFGALEYWSANGSQVITFPNDGTIINGANFGVKFRCEVKTTGTHELFKIGNDILVTLESGKLRVRLSSDGVTYQKDYISTTNVSAPSGITYADTIPHIWVGFYFNAGTLKLYNDFVEFTTIKTVDSALSSVNNSGASILFGQNATLQLRSYSILGAHTSQKFIDLEI